MKTADTVIDVQNLTDSADARRHELEAALTAAKKGVLADIKKNSAPVQA